MRARLGPPPARRAGGVRRAPAPPRRGRPAVHEPRRPSRASSRSSRSRAPGRARSATSSRAPATSTRARGWSPPGRASSSSRCSAGSRTGSAIRAEAAGIARQRRLGGEPDRARRARASRCVGAMARRPRRLRLRPGALVARARRAHARLPARTRCACCRSTPTCRLRAGHARRSDRGGRARGTQAVLRLPRTAARRTPARSTRCRELAEHLPGARTSGCTSTRPTAASRCSPSAAATRSPASSSPTRSRSTRTSGSTSRTSAAACSSATARALRARLRDHARLPAATRSRRAGEVNFSDLGLQLTPHVARAQGLALAPLLRPRRVPRGDRPHARPRRARAASASRRATRSSCSRRRRSASSASGGASAGRTRRRSTATPARRRARGERRRARLLDAAARPLRDPACACSATRREAADVERVLDFLETAELGDAETSPLARYERHPDITHEPAGRRSRPASPCSTSCRRRMRAECRARDVRVRSRRGETIVEQWRPTRDFFVVVEGTVDVLVDGERVDRARAGRVLRRDRGARLGRRLRVPADRDGRRARRRSGCSSTRTQLAPDARP